MEVDALPPLMSAYVVRDAPCCISRELAQQYDPSIKEGQLLFLVLVEQIESGEIHEYPLAFPVSFARTKRPDYVQISLDHVRLMFDIAEYEPKKHESPEARMLILRLRRCVRYSSGSSGGEDIVPV